MLATAPTLPPDFKGTNTVSEIQVDPGGRFLYVSNRGHDSLAVFAIDQVKGTLTPVERIPTTGKVPRYFTFDPTGRFVLVANQESNNVLLCRFDEKTGHLTPTGASIEVPAAVCLVFAPATR